MTWCPVEDQDDILNDAIIEALQFIADLSQEGDESLTIVRSLLHGNEIESLVRHCDCRLEGCLPCSCDEPAALIAL